MYTFLGLLTNLHDDFYSIPGLNSMLVNGVFSSHTFLENRHWRSLIGSFIKPLIINCPPAYFDTVLNPVLPPFVDFFTQKLDKEWLEVLDRGIKTEEEDGMMDGSSVGGADEDLSDELVNEKILRGLTCNYADTLAHIFSPGPMEKKEGEKRSTRPGAPLYYGVQLDDFRYKTLLQYLATNPNVFLHLLGSIANILRYPDLLALRRVLSTTQRLIPLLAREAAFTEFIGNTMMKAILGALRDEYHFDVHGDLHSLLTDIYLLCPPPLPRQILQQVTKSTDATMQEFDVSIQACPSHRDQAVLMKALLANVVSVEKSQQFAQAPKSQHALQKEAKKKLLKELNKDQKDDFKTDVLSTEEHAALDGLFEPTQ